MVFNSTHFLVFFFLVFFMYWFLFQKKLATQNFFIVCVSYLFYGWWDYRFLSLIFISSLLDYSLGLLIFDARSPSRKKLILMLSIFINLGILFIFKYFNFFAESFISVLHFFGFETDFPTLQIILPVGLSFYTFQSLSYAIDVYRGKITPTRNVVVFMAFVSFFPQLVAGPIERAVHLLPQFEKKRFFDYEKAADGMRQILWGLFKKVVVADNCAPHVNAIFENYAELDNGTLFLGAVLFAFQIYGDFSGYSDIAIGLARVFGFQLMQNFNFPYFSRDIAEFWRRWHISLSGWFKDYVYIPLGGSKGGFKKQIFNTFIIFIISGFWHGANWTFILWGLINSLYYVPLLITGNHKKNTGDIESSIPSIKIFFQIILTFTLTTFAWILFRAESASVAFKYIGGIFNGFPSYKEYLIPAEIFAYILFLLIAEWLQRKKKHALEIHSLAFPSFVRWAIYICISLLIGTYFGNSNSFIYFQF